MKLKAGPLTPAEHANRGSNIAARVPALGPSIDGIRYHHERMDGTGYSEGLRGEDIPVQARIVAIADAFDAMTSGRAYQPAIDRLTNVVFQRFKLHKLLDVNGGLIEFYLDVVDSARGLGRLAPSLLLRPSEVAALGSRQFRVVIV